MKQLAFAVAVLACGTVGVQAADLAVRPVKAPVIVDPGYNWTGFYAGVNVGYSWGRSSTT
jgi:outer membrane immunogenic protein